jgi:nanoRNase/pAp phosphatase (c-di-AMP/oligoRNAs hydrolase)
VVKLVTGRIRLDGGVATYDLADLGVDSVNKFIAYAADPTTVYTVSVSRGTGRSKISLGSNPWKQHLRTHNLARIAERYGGGGHPAVAAISFPPEQLEEARAAAAVIVDELRQPQKA